MAKNHYIIGDLQGCYRAFNALLDKINFDESTDYITLCGDIVARGDDSLNTLRQVKQLSDKGVLSTVLGNHDITLIANWLGLFKPKKKDNTANILKAQDCDELLEWLRCQPFLIDISTNSQKALVTHAGIPHIWSDDNAREFARTAQAFFSKDKTYLKNHLLALYDKNTMPSDKYIADIRLIVNYFTRMRLINKYGVLDFEFKDNPLNPACKLPTGFYPWYEFDNKRSARIYFGHWASLMANIDKPHARALDGGAVWGGHLVAYHLDSGQIITVCNHLDG